MNYDRNFINGVWTRVSGTSLVNVYDSASEDIIATVKLSEQPDVDLAVTAARAAFATWSALAVQERAGFVMAIGDALEQYVDDLAASISAEVGMPVKLSRRIQVLGPIMAWKETARRAIETLVPQVEANSTITYEPTGVVAAITPWNYPLHQMTGKLAAALMAGCTLVLKPAELAPSAAFALGKAIEQAQLPAGVVNIIFGDALAGEALTGHPGIDMISFTGSTAVGRKIGAVAGRNLKRLALELGGKSAGISLPDADAAVAVRHAVSSCFLNSGQTCSAITRLIIPETLYETYRQLLVNAAEKVVLGDPRDPAVRAGPLVSAAQRDRVLSMLRAVDMDVADLIAGGADASVPNQGFYVAPTIVGRVSADSVLAQEEVFGPVLVVQTYRSIGEAIDLANGTAYGLAAAVWGAHDEAIRVASELRAGQVDVNGAPFNPSAPFGGFAASGIGREGGAYGILHFTETKSIQIPMASNI